MFFLVKRLELRGWLDAAGHQVGRQEALPLTVKALQFVRLVFLGVF